LSGPQHPSIATEVQKSSRWVRARLFLSIVVFGVLWAGLIEMPAVVAAVQQAVRTHVEPRLNVED